MPSVVTVIVEWQGSDKPARISRGRRSWVQWLGDDTIRQMGMTKVCEFKAEYVESVWYIGPRCDGHERKQIG
jgi:hypothetical protein